MTEVKIVVAGVEVTTRRHVSWRELWPMVRAGQRLAAMMEKKTGRKDTGSEEAWKSKTVA